MILDHTFQTNQTGLEELVPSRYAMHVGDIEVLVISDGVLPLPTKMLAANPVPTFPGHVHGDDYFPSEYGSNFSPNLQITISPSPAKFTPDTAKAFPFQENSPPLQFRN